MSFEELGGADVHMEKSGVAHDQAVLDLIKKLLSYLPQNKERPWRKHGNIPL